MPIGKVIERLTIANVNKSPMLSGVYALWRHDMLIYYGMAIAPGGLNFELREQLLSSGSRSVCSHHATHFNYEVNPNPEPRLRQLLEEYYSAYGCQPERNEEEV